MMLILLLGCTDPERPFGGLLQRSVDADGDGWDSDLDCDDQDPQVNPGAQEQPYNGVDDDCDAASPDDDLDGDGFPLAQDCEDDDPSVHPGAEDPPDGHDQDCDGVDSCGALVLYEIPMTLYEEDLDFFCDSEFNATDERLTVSTEQPSLARLLCLCQAEELLLLTPNWSEGSDLDQLQRIGHLEINANMALSELLLNQAEQVELLGLTALADLVVEGASSLRLESHSEGLEELSVEFMDLRTSANPGLKELTVRVDDHDLWIGDEVALTVLGERGGEVHLNGVLTLQSELVEVASLWLTNTGLSDLDGLAELRTVRGDVLLRGNADLDPAAIELWLQGVDVGGAVVVENNG